jgi:LmbE family N-acetylglucosaminyl deacetylase
MPDSCVGQFASGSLYVNQPAAQFSLPWIPAEFARVVVISPHMDDAILSCGGLLDFLLKKLECLTVTVCTADPENVSHENPPHGIALPSARRNEEVAALNALGCSLVQLDLLDAIYRRNPTTGALLYPTMESIWSMPLVQDEFQFQALRSRLLSLCGQTSERPTLILSPMGIGHHVDHILSTQVALSVVGSANEILLYEDFPYVVDQGAHVGVADDAQRAMQRLGVTGVECFEQECDTSRKINWISYYASQINSIFGSHENVKPLLMKNSKNGNTVERFWKVRKN